MKETTNPLDKALLKLIQEQFKQHQGYIPNYGPIRGELHQWTKKYFSIGFCQRKVISLCRQHYIKKHHRQHINQYIEYVYGHDHTGEKKPDILEIVNELRQQKETSCVPPFVLTLYVQSALHRVKKREKEHVSLSLTLPIQCKKRNDHKLSFKDIGQVVSTIVDEKRYPALNHLSLRTFIVHYGGYIGKTIRNNIEEEAFKRLSSPYISKKTNAYTAPILNANRQRLSEDELKQHGFKAIILYKSHSIEQMTQMEYALQKELQYIPFGKRLWSIPSKSGRIPKGTPNACKVYFTYSKQLNMLVERNVLILNQ